MVQNHTATDPLLWMRGVCKTFDRPVVHDLGLEVRPCEVYALVGASGCGKTTLLKVMLGLLHPQEGEVLYGGVPVKHLGLQNYRRVDLPPQAVTVPPPQPSRAVGGVCIETGR